MAILATAMLSEIQYHLLEDVDGGLTWVSGHWTAAEVYGYVKRRFASFLRDAQIVTERTLIVTSPEEPIAQLPEDWQMTVRAAWRKDTDGVNSFRELARTDFWEMDHVYGGGNDNPWTEWPNEDTTAVPRPNRYSTGEVPPPAMELHAPPDGPGQLELLYIALPSGFDPTTSNFDPLPDDFVQYIKYGVMCDMLSKVGRGQDLLRAGYCSSRYDEGIQLSQLILKGLAG